MNTKLATAIALVGLMQSSAVFALGLGEIQVASAVNERLDAAIPLVNSKGLDASQILVTLASKADFARAGVDRDYFLTNLEFSVERSSSGMPLLRVETPDVVLEPYLNFLIEVRWPQGRLLREYTVLLDLPNYSAAPARIVTPPAPVTNRTDNGGSVSRNSAARPSAAPSRRPSGTSGQSSNQPVASSASASGTHTIRANDTLWEIALDVKPANASVHQTMLALQELNPQAFINNNINLLKKGSVLRVPDGQDIASVDARSARNSVSQQQERWQGDVSEPRSNLNAGLDARASSARNTAGANTADGHLQLASSPSTKPSSSAIAANADARGASTASSSSAGAESGEQLSAEVARLQNELAISLENLDRASVENTSMDGRLEGMESQLTDLERLVSLKDQELQAMRTAFEARSEVLADSGINIADTSSADVNIDDTAISEAVNNSIDSAESIAESNTEIAETIASDVAVTEAPVEEEQGLLATIASTLSLSVEWLIGVGIAVIAAAVAFFMWMVGRRQEDYEATVFDPVSSLAAEDRFDEQSEEAFTAEHDEAFDSDTQSADHSDAERFETVINEQDDSIADAVSEDTQTADINEALAGNESDHDPIAEADIYLAYGRHEQAQQMLDVAIEREPARADLRLKLLEVHVDQNSPDQFKAACQSLLAIDPAANIAAEALLADVDNAADWWPEGSVAAPADEFLESYTEGNDIVDADLGLDLNLDLDTDQNSATEVSAEGGEPEEFGLQLAYDADAATADAATDDSTIADDSNHADEVGTKLDLARAYIDMGDFDGAREILDEVLSEGSTEQRDQANTMMERIAG